MSSSTDGRRRERIFKAWQRGSSLEVGGLKHCKHGSHGSWSGYIIAAHEQEPSFVLTQESTTGETAPDARGDLELPVAGSSTAMDPRAPHAAEQAPTREQGPKRAGPRAGSANMTRRFDFMLYAVCCMPRARRLGQYRNRADNWEQRLGYVRSAIVWCASRAAAASCGS